MASSRRLEDHFWKGDRENVDLTATEAEPTSKRTAPPPTPPVLTLPVETLTADGMSNPPGDGSTNSDNLQSTPESEEYISFAHISPPGTPFPLFAGATRPDHVLTLVHTCHGHSSEHRSQGHIIVV